MMGKAKSAKKRWRKTDISDIEAALVKEKQVEELLGTKPATLHELPNESLYKIDKIGAKKTRNKEFYRQKVLSYEKSLQPSHILPPTVPQIKSTKSSDGLTMAERIADKRVKKAEKREKALSSKNNNNGVYDIWGVAAGATEKPFYGPPKPQKSLIRKPSELPSLALPGSENSYNPSEEDIKKVVEKAQAIEQKLKKQTEFLERASQPIERLRTAYEIKKSLPKLTQKELMKIKKDAKKGRKKPSKPYQTVTNKHFSTKMTTTERNKQKRRKTQLHIERKNKLEKKRNEDIDNVEKYTAAVESRMERSKKRREISIAMRKLNAFKTKKLRQRFMRIPSSAVLKNRLEGSLRTLKPYGHEIHERVLRYEQRNMVVG